ncbi:MAG: uracil phosphoribosyltransferase [Sumerlaeia bacterium]
MAVHIVNHPVITHKLNALRNKKTQTQEFRRVVNELTLLLSYEATRNLPVHECTLETPITSMKSETLAGNDFIICPILRAGLGMVHGMLSIFPEARVAHIGLKRNEETAMPVFYYQSMPEDLSSSTVIVVDPMLATGGSLSEALALVKQHNPVSIKAICLVAAPEGKQYIEEQHPDVDVFVAALDEQLNEQKYIVPGLGDAGDRMFGTGLWR